MSKRPSKLEDFSIEELLSKPYRWVFVPTQNGGYKAWIQEFPGCLVHGLILDDVREKLTNAVREWIHSAVRSGLPIPPPTGNESIDSEETPETSSYVAHLTSLLKAVLFDHARASGISPGADATVLDWGTLDRVHHFDLEIVDHLPHKNRYQTGSSRVAEFVPLHHLRTTTLSLKKKQ